MERYILITSRMNGCDQMSLMINDIKCNDALTKAYKYIGGRVKDELFQQALDNMDINNALELFQLLTGDTVLYFGTEKYGYKCELTEI